MAYVICYVTDPGPIRIWSERPQIPTLTNSDDLLFVVVDLLDTLLELNFRFILKVFVQDTEDSFSFEECDRIIESSIRISIPVLFERPTV